MEGVDDFSNIVREWRKKIPQDYPDVAFCILHALGQIHYDEGNFGESLDCFLQELPLRKKVLGKNHISVSYVLVAIASIMYLHERVNQAAYYLKEAINVITFHQYRRKNTTNLMLESNRMIWYRLSDTLNDIGKIFYELVTLDSILSHVAVLYISSLIFFQEIDIFSMVTF